ncbi:GumC family protein [Stratiformator vulcanicus]|uniref:Chain length determinant protein n=1 Tax=Stratiformator vulcanicus TaxID=2527980 RepID=A0A517R470_9PLAN|nr:hypothetical protein [Stratiformator vulcanicus]QDT38640.1 Chain length determinant protein [Stratiformator vulcanicus]
MIAPSQRSDDSPQIVRIAWDVAAAVWRHRFKSLIVFASLMGLIVFAVMVTPRTYRSEAKLFVRIGGESIKLDPTATTAQTISVYESRESELNSVLDVLHSRILLEEVAASIGTDVLLHDAPIQNEAGELVAIDNKANAATFDWSPMELVRPLLRTIGLSDAVSEQEQAVQMLSRNVQFSSGKKSSVVSIVATAGSPELAQLIAAEIVDVFRRKHMQVHRTDGSQEFFEKQTELLKNQFEVAAGEVQEMKTELNLVTLDGKRSAIESQINDLEADILETEKLLATSKAQIASMERVLEEIPQQQVTSRITGSPNSAADQIRRQISEMRIRERTLLAKFQPTHPAILSVNEQVERAEQQLSRLDSTDAQETAAVNPGHQQISLRLLDERTKADSLLARRDALNRQFLQATARLENLNAHESQLTMLEQRRDILETNFRTYSEKYEQARIDTALADDSISNVNVYQTATLETKPISPKKKMIFAAGFIFAVLAAIGTALGLEYWPRLVPQGVRLPSDVSIPRRRTTLQEA